jgi:hypothetical protein
MTVKLERRYFRLKNEQTILEEKSFNLIPELTGIRHYLAYMIVRILSRPVFMLGAYGIKELYKHKGKPKDASFRLSHEIFCLLSVIVLLHSVFFLKELKVGESNPAKQLVR